MTSSRQQTPPPVVRAAGLRARSHTLLVAALAAAGVVFAALSLIEAIFRSGLPEAAALISSLIFELLPSLVAAGAVALLCRRAVWEWIAAAVITVYAVIWTAMLVLESPLWSGGFTLTGLGNYVYPLVFGLPPLLIAIALWALGLAIRAFLIGRHSDRAAQPAPSDGDGEDPNGDGEDPDGGGEDPGQAADSGGSSEAASADSSRDDDPAGADSAASVRLLGTSMIIGALAYSVVCAGALLAADMTETKTVMMCLFAIALPGIVAAILLWTLKPATAQPGLAALLSMLVFAVPGVVAGRLFDASEFMLPLSLAACALGLVTWWVLSAVLRVPHPALPQPSPRARQIRLPLSHPAR
ncbi:DUF5316 domain-containing protein [Brevibacterium luteolum]|uniref:DUF5316 domain-containing protein n=1 Tax=Brevibacterium luteolum TaxID=199591 RepID=UPI00223B972F|nr:DUF5316 domain-containing protein [Brevibacterium luteolum]MCT1922106.1 DUF5316 domain-containing protein [Brevibacterium luteolum]